MFSPVCSCPVCGSPRPARVLPALTPAERRVAEAVAGGATNQQIASRLFLSLRTVESHLGRVYRKLGIANRTQLAGLLVAS